MPSFVIRGAVHAVVQMAVFERFFFGCLAWGHGYYDVEALDLPLNVFDVAIPLHRDTAALEDGLLCRVTG
jgi:hypothetical protein